MHNRQVMPFRHCGLDPQSTNKQMIVLGGFRIKCGMTCRFLLKMHKQLTEIQN